MGTVYFFTDGENIKIGYTSGDVFRRLHQLNTGSPCQLYLLGYIAGTKKTEHELHAKFEKDRLRMNGEWFRGSPELISYINEINQRPNVYIERSPHMQNKIISLLKLAAN